MLLRLLMETLKSLSKIEKDNTKSVFIILIEVEVLDICCGTSTEHKIDLYFKFQ